MAVFDDNELAMRAVPPEVLHNAYTNNRMMFNVDEVGDDSGGGALPTLARVLRCAHANIHT
jgi:hypothetical protein